jgi:hypothetical protein
MHNYCHENLLYHKEIFSCLVHVHVVSLISFRFIFIQSDPIQFNKKKPMDIEYIQQASLTYNNMIDLGGKKKYYYLVLYINSQFHIYEA